MVWAATKISIWDDVYPTFKSISIEYKGKNPHLIYKKINELIRSDFHVPEGCIQEKEYTWNKTEKGEEFKVEWETTKVLDDFSFIKIEIKLSGFMSEGVGKASVGFRPTLITEYPQDTFWQQNILYEMLRRLWHNIFYSKKRNEYFDMTKTMAERFERGIKDFIEELR